MVFGSVGGLEEGRGLEVVVKGCECDVGSV